MRSLSLLETFTRRSSKLTGGFINSEPFTSEPYERNFERTFERTYEHSYHQNYESTGCH